MPHLSKERMNKLHAAAQTFNERTDRSWSEDLVAEVMRGQVVIKFKPGRNKRAAFYRVNSIEQLPSDGGDHGTDW